jgi:hypothetical protein
MSRKEFADPQPPVRQGSVRRRELGWLLRQAMRERGLRLQDVSPVVGLDYTVVSRILSGQQRCAVETAMGVMVEARAGHHDRRRAAVLAREDARDVGWPFYLTRGPARWDVLLREAGTAQAVTEWAPAQLPWVVQTPGYTRALLDADHPTEPGVIEDRMKPRRRLTDLLTVGWDRRRPPRWQFLIHEHALRTPPGPVLDATGPWQRAVMAGQLQHLDQLITQAAIPIRVVPAEQGVVGGGGFALLEFERYRPVVYRDEHDTGLFIEDSTIIDTVRTDIEGLFAVALSVTDSRALIARIAADSYGLPDDETRHSG